MKRFIALAVVGLFLVGGAAFSQEYVPQNVSPTGALDWMVYDMTDALGDVLQTIPLANPGPSNAWVGTAYAGGYIYVLKNVASPQSVQLIKIDPANGNVINTTTVLNTAYCMGASADATGIWIVQWYPTASNIIYKIDFNGSIVSQFTSPTGSYSARAIAYDNGNLWVGANLGSNDTKLFKLSTTGSILEQYTTGSVVGWYMDGELSAEAPAGQNLYVIDNVGNTLKRLAVSGGSVTIVDQGASPAVSPDVAEGIGHNGQNLWHQGAYANQQMMLVDDGFVGTPLDVEITLTPYGTPIQIPAIGGTFEFNVALTNNETSSSNFDAWTMATLPSGSEYGPILLVNVTLGASISVNRDRIQNVPGNAPTGAYVYHGYVGYYPSIVWDEDSFPFSKLATDNGGPAVSDWNNWGESFEDLMSGTTVSTPAEYALNNAYPNPFNPETNISFALKKAGHVTLKIYNIMGEEVASLVDGYMNEGVHEFIFNGHGLSSGLYLYSIQANDFHAVKKMMLLK